MRDAFNDLRAHQLGIMAGMRSALEGVLQRFDPAVLEGQITKRSGLSALLGGNRKAQLWEQFQQLYTQLSSEAADDFHTLFGKAFLQAYEKKYNDYPRLNSVVGYATVKAIAAGIQKAGGTDTEKLIAAFKGLPFSSPFGPVVFRPQDNQSTLGIFVGRTAIKDGKGSMPGGSYIDGAKLQPPEEVVRKLRSPT